MLYSDDSCMRDECISIYTGWDVLRSKAFAMHSSIAILKRSASKNSVGCTGQATIINSRRPVEGHNVTKKLLGKAVIDMSTHVSST